MRKRSDEETKRRRDEARGTERAHFVSPSLRLSVSPSLAFTVTELLIVIGVIVLALALAVPAFNFITGSKSIDTAQNNISAFLARARNEAIGLQQYRGVFFFIDPKTARVNMALVSQAAADSSRSVNVDLYLDLADTDTVALPQGVGIQFINNSGLTMAGGKVNDGYIGFNTQNNMPLPPPDVDTLVPYGGVMLFDAAGRLASRSYALLCVVPLSAPMQYTAMGHLLYNSDESMRVGGRAKDVVPVNPAPALAAKVLRSQIGFVLFDLQALKNQFAGDDALKDQQVENTTMAWSTTSVEAQKEQWLDENATPVLINRYNGTLVKGE
jgi:type II secretory pathway pseudopilin PulG